MRSLLSAVLPAAAISNLGDGAMVAAGPLLVASITDQPFAVGAAAFVQQLPWLMFALFSGALVDRLDRRLMIVAAGALLVTVVPKTQLGKANARLYATGTIFNQLGGPPIRSTGY
jgi:MFS family permease